MDLVGAIEHTVAKNNGIDVKDCPFSTPLDIIPDCLCMYLILCGHMLETPVQ